MLRLGAFNSSLNVPNYPRAILKSDALSVEKLNNTILLISVGSNCIQALIIVNLSNH